MLSRTISMAVLIAGTSACGDGTDATIRAPRIAHVGPRPDEMPALVNAELPFRYPAELYAQKVQGNVTLKLFIDRDGRVVPDSVRVEEASGYVALDSAAMKGAPDLHFVPAKLHGESIPVSLLFPVYFRHPEARPLPGDSVLRALKPGSDL